MTLVRYNFRPYVGLQQKHDDALKQKDTEIRSLDMQIHKLQSALDSAVKPNDKLKADIKDKTTELSNRVIDLEKLNVRYDVGIIELKEAKADLKAANKAETVAEKLVFKLEGQLDVYKSIDKKSVNKLK